MNDPLKIYLHDHLAGSVQAVEVLEHVRDEHRAEPLGSFADSLLVEMEADRKVSQEIAERIGDAPTGLKDATAWLAEKFGTLKLSRGTNEFGTFEALEFLVLGIPGKRALWRTLILSCKAWIIQR